MKIIKIKGGNITTGELDLSDKGHTKATKRERVKWKVKNDATNVASIEGVPLKSGTTDIFIDLPRREDGRNWRADIADDVHVGEECDYSIRWKDTNGNEHLHDPKISIKPGYAPALLIPVIVGVAAISVLLLRRYLRKGRL